jgi:hypothetical protein
MQHGRDFCLGAGAQRIDETARLLAHAAGSGNHAHQGRLALLYLGCMAVQLAVPQQLSRARAPSWISWRALPAARCGS